MIGAEPTGRDTFFESLLNRFSKDAADMGLRRTERFVRFLGVLASHLGEELPIGTLRKETGVAAETVRDWISVARALDIVRFLPAFHERVSATTVRKPILLFTDTGFAAWLLRIPSPEVLSVSYARERLFRNFVIMEIWKSWVHNGLSPALYHYRDTRRRTIDLLIRQGDAYHPVAIRLTDAPDRSDIDDFDVLNGTTFRRGQGSLVCMCAEARYLTSDVICKPPITLGSGWRCSG